MQTRLCQALVKVDGVWTPLEALRGEAQLLYSLDQFCEQLFMSWCVDFEALAELRTDMCTRVETRALAIRHQRFIVCWPPGYLAIFTSAPESLVSSIL